MVDFVIGVDGGGTGCRAAVAGRDGRIVATGAGGAANVLSDRAGSLRNIRTAIDAALAAAGLDKGALQRSGVLLGLAGSNVGDTAAFVAASLPAGRVEVVSDGLIALEGAIGDGDGAVAILGTGSIFFARLGGAVRSYGGWGFVIGDFGSGASLGRVALSAALLAHDRIIAASPLTHRLIAEFGGAPGPMVEFARTATPGDFGRFAPAVFAAAEEGDAVALDIVTKAAASVDLALDRIVDDGVDRISLLGGLAPLYPAYLAARHRPRLMSPVGNALAGAVALAARRFLGSEGGAQ
ncbi:Glucosamine kinase GspK [Pleomorphomonas sp. T1.2MG-36]|uniref:BadF/BadG/BcrA/BcrD ATPase family protein n=1 Tax=Pleomorphomonas sp. T1.2MG-36 TaxID=3041167 RepID=UPI002477774A|nr:BadF/BadG/BcrA/BcrD ATPase family protein [Pleomorphomonas sp. T1.2MG-36]CAI9406125.1 Glucosamine kinase GspK [Pleomorphomonas sp. T1.2MG-36]